MVENIIMEEKTEYTFCFNFVWPKYVDKTLKHEIKFILKNYNL